jgi:hypothetical protein
MKHTDKYRRLYKTKQVLLSYWLVFRGCQVSVSTETPTVLSWLLFSSVLPVQCCSSTSKCARTASFHIPSNSPLDAVRCGLLKAQYKKPQIRATSKQNDIVLRPYRRTGNRLTQPANWNVKFEVKYGISGASSHVLRNCACTDRQTDRQTDRLADTSTDKSNTCASGKEFKKVQDKMAHSYFLCAILSWTFLR